MKTTYLICLPFAGAGASFFKDWQALAPEGLHIVPVQLPGREERFIDAPHTEVARAVEEAYSATLGQLAGADQVAVFGHSLGAVLAYELAHQLAGTQGVSLARLFVSGSPGPWNGRESRATGLDDEAFLAQVREFAGYNHPALEHPEMRALLLPMLRADVEMHENYRPSSDKPLDVAITALRGRDDELVDSALIAQWREATTAEFAPAELDGGHMYLADGAEALLQLIAAELGTADAR
ncbi:alpha/beta fold hydrolase [Streptomyces sp. NBC_00249]|uniref:thioesterase II family protein n=1 Tax=Streptomyces sp. NBC_00249 TaxID=2975690 RepID=UPI0022555B54|nr:alpha/beta fold hydrolase [Streptomyces sp. NBC_00249]MCX5193517.1 alpha/beta fold hydrolase [Streptomyces sp. NBC_00249]